MTQIEFEYTDNIVNHLLKVSELLALINTYWESIHKTSKKFIEFEDTLRIEALYSFSACTNYGASYKNSRALVSGTQMGANGEEYRILMNLRDIIDYIDAFYKSENFDLNQFIHINKLFLNGLLEEWDYGKLLHTKYELDNKYNFPIEKKIIREADTYQVMQQFEDYSMTNPTSSLIKNAIIFYELLTNAFFAAGNDISALGLFVFMNRKMNLHPYINYYHVVSTSLLSGQKITTVTEWLDVYFSHLKDELEHFRVRLLPFVELAVEAKQKYVDINLRQMKGLEYMMTKGTISRDMYAKLNKISHITSYRDLSDLVKKKYIFVIGSGKGTRYKL